MQRSRALAVAFTAAVLLTGALAPPVVAAEPGRAPRAAASQPADSPGSWFEPLLALWRSWWDDLDHRSAADDTGGDLSGTTPSVPPDPPVCPPANTEGPCVDPVG
jgi:hypothetical protein